MFSRARVAISLHDKSLTPNPIHVGHARTLVLGELVAKHYNCPYHVRLDTRQRHLYDGSMPPLVLKAILNIANCLSFLEIDYDEILPVAERSPTIDEMAKEIGKERAQRVDRLFHTTGMRFPIHRSIYSDDSWWNHKSLMVRGMEFKHQKYRANRGGLGSGSRMLRTEHPQMVAERMIFDAMGRKRYETNVPLIMNPDGDKVSKTSGTPLSWKKLKDMPSDIARKFLLSTVFHPENPLGHMEDVIDGSIEPESIPEKNYVWDESIWDELIDCFC